MAYCSPCPSGNITGYTVDACDLKSSLMKSGISRLLLLKCAEVLTDVTSTVEWTALVSGADAEVTPQGKAAFPEPTYELVEIDACGTKVNIDGKVEVEFSTFLLDPTADGHNTFINDYNELAQSYTILFLGCDNRMYYSYAWATGTNPGFGINNGYAFLKDDGKLKTMTIKAELDVTSGLYKSFVLTAAMKTALGI
jgi:hypothetical protein